MKPILWWKRHFLPAELALAIVVGTGFIAWDLHFHGVRVINQTLAGNRGAIYNAAATIFASLFGFVIASVAIVLGFSGNERLEPVRKSAYFNDLWNIFTSAIRALSVATIASFFGLIFDRDAPAYHGAAHTGPHHLLTHHVTFGQAILFLCVFAAVLSVLRLARCIWILERLIVLITRPSPARSGE